MRGMLPICRISGRGLVAALVRDINHHLAPRRRLEAGDFPLQLGFGYPRRGQEWVSAIIRDKNHRRRRPNLRRNTIEAELIEESGQVFGERLALEQYGEHRA